MDTENRFVTEGSYSAPSWSQENTSTSAEASQNPYGRPLLPRDYQDCRRFVRKVIPQLLETVDRKRPLPHLRPFTTPDIMSIVEKKADQRAAALAKLSPHAADAQILRSPLRLMRLHMRARTLSAAEFQSSAAAEKQLPPGYKASFRPGEHATASASSASPYTHLAPQNLLLEVCGTYREGKRVQAFAAAAKRCDSQWRLTEFNFI